MNTLITIAQLLFQCSTTQLDHPSHHNLFVFGQPGKALYAYHLTMFSMPEHAYQVLWKINLSAKDLKWYQSQKSEYFTFGHESNATTIPSLLCKTNKNMAGSLYYGHLENLEGAPAPIKMPWPITLDLSNLMYSHQYKTFFDDDYYLIFGEKSDTYALHLLSGKVKSVDQIFRIETKMQTPAIVKGTSNFKITKKIYLNANSDLEL